jgi:hypothetical protein
VFIPEDGKPQNSSTEQLHAEREGEERERRERQSDRKAEGEESERQPEARVCGAYSHRGLKRIPRAKE